MLFFLGGGGGGGLKVFSLPHSQDKPALQGSSGKRANKVGHRFQPTNSRQAKLASSSTNQLKMILITRIQHSSARRKRSTIVTRIYGQSTAQGTVHAMKASAEYEYEFSITKLQIPNYSTGRMQSMQSISHKSWLTAHKGMLTSRSTDKPVSRPSALLLQAHQQSRQVSQSKQSV